MLRQLDFTPWGTPWEKVVLYSRYGNWHLKHTYSGQGSDVLKQRAQA